LRRKLHFETRTSLGGKEILIVDLKVTDARNDCAGKGQQQFNRPRELILVDGNKQKLYKVIRMIMFAA
jgi:hypothetical protein